MDKAPTADIIIFVRRSCKFSNILKAKIKAVNLVDKHVITFVDLETKKNRKLIEKHNITGVPSCIITHPGEDPTAVRSAKIEDLISL